MPYLTPFKYLNDVIFYFDTITNVFPMIIGLQIYYKILICITHCQLQNKLQIYAQTYIKWLKLNLYCTVCKT